MQLIFDALVTARNGTASKLGLNPGNLYSRMNQLGIPRPAPY